MTNFPIPPVRPHSVGANSMQRFAARPRRTEGPTSATVTVPPDMKIAIEAISQDAARLLNKNAWYGVMHPFAEFTRIKGRSEPDTRNIKSNPLVQSGLLDSYDVKQLYEIAMVSAALGFPIGTTSAALLQTITERNLNAEVISFCEPGEVISASTLPALQARRKARQSEIQAKLHQANMATGLYPNVTPQLQFTLGKIHELLPYCAQFNIDPTEPVSAMDMLAKMQAAIVKRNNILLGLPVETPIETLVNEQNLRRTEMGRIFGLSLDQLVQEMTDSYKQLNPALFATATV